MSFLNPFPGGGAHLASGAERPALLRCGRYSTGANESSDVRNLGFNPLSLGFESLEGSHDCTVWAQRISQSSARSVMEAFARRGIWVFSASEPRAFRRANINRRQEAGSSANEASKIARHSDLEARGKHTFVTPERRNELTRRIQQKLPKAGKKTETETAEPVPPAPTAPEVPPSLADVEPATRVVQ